MKLECLHSFDLGVKAGMVRSANVKLKDRDAMLFVYTEGIGVDPGGGIVPSARHQAGTYCTV